MSSARKSSSATQDGEASASNSSNSHGMSGSTTQRKAPAAAAVTSNSPSLSPLNDPLLPSSVANTEILKGQGNRAAVEESWRQAEEIRLALSYGAGEPIKVKGSNSDSSRTMEEGGINQRSAAPDSAADKESDHDAPNLYGARPLMGVTSKHEENPLGVSHTFAYRIRRSVLHFTPSWFSVTMGTGVIATLFSLLGQIWAPYSPGFASFIRWPALVYLLADIIIFLVFSAAFLARYILFPQVLPLTLKHPQKSLFIGTVPMGLITITSGISQLGTTEFGLGLWPTLLAVGLWFFCCLLSTVVAIGIPWSIFTYQQGHRFEGTTAALLLPIVPPITAAATASNLAEKLVERYPTLSFTIMSVGYMQLGIGLPLAMMILVLYLQRLILFKAPPREVIVSVFLPLGPCGQGGEAALHLGQVALALFPTISSRPGSGVPQLTLGVGQALYGAGLATALLLFALGLWWAAIAAATFIVEWHHGRIKFNMGFWSFTFPIASLAICTARLALDLDSLTIKIVYTGFVLVNWLLWISVAIPTVKGFFSGDLLIAPCIADLPLDPLAGKR